MWTSIGVVVGIGLVILTGLQWIDPVVAIAVALNLAYEGYKIVRKSAGSLIDEVDNEALLQLAHALESMRTPGIIDVHKLKIIRAGRFHHVDAHLVIPEYWDISHAHTYCEDFEGKVVSDYPFDGEIAFHLDPCKRLYCERCKMEECPIRLRAFKKQIPFTVESLIGGPKYPENIEV